MPVRYVSIVGSDHVALAPTEAHRLRAKVIANGWTDPGVPTTKRELAVAAVEASIPSMANVVQMLREVAEAAIRRRESQARKDRQPE